MKPEKDRHKTWRERHDVRSVRITGEAWKALSEYKQKNGLSFSDAIMELLNEKE